MSVRKQIDILVRLQSIDSEMQKVNRMLAAVPDRVGSLDADLEGQEAALNQFVSELEEDKKRYRSLESDANSNLPKIEKSKARLSSVKTNKEYQSLLKEIEDLKGMTSRFEDEMLECLERIDLGEQHLFTKKEAVNKVRIQVDREKEDIEQEAEKGRQLLEKLEKDWQVVCETVAPDFMARFEKVRKQVGNYTIARVVQAVCEGCNMNIPPQMYNELQRCETMMFCPHCQRIMYTENEQE